MSNEARPVLSDDDLRLLIGILSVFETTYLTEDAENIVRVMKERFVKDRTLYGVNTEILDDREALWRLNVRVRNALGENLTPEGSIL
jgi:hypothetical protein